MRLIKACEILDYAINNHVSAKAACKMFGFGKNYVSDVKRSYVFVHTELQKEFDKKYDEYEKNKYNTPQISNRIISGTSISSNIINDRKPVIESILITPNLPEPKETEIDNKITVIDDGNEKTIEWSGNNYSSDHIKTLEDLLIATKTDRELWKVKSHIVNKWDTTFVDANKNPRTIQNFQVKAILEKNISYQNNISVVDELSKMLENYNAPILEVPIAEPNEENNLLEISLFDLHMGKLAWHGETGENYDTKIASERFIKAINALIHRASAFTFNRILFPVGNDFFNSDNLNNTTTHGTPQDEDLRWQKTFEVGFKLLDDAIMLLKQTGVPVDVMVIPGNHDFERSFVLGVALKAQFNNDTQVIVNNGASPRKYYKFGTTLLGFTHGSEEKEASLPMIMANDIDSKPAWSETIFHEWHLGHQHRKKGYKYNVNKDTIFNEESGVIVRYLSSLTGTEEWHHKKGYIGAIKAGEAFIWSDVDGMVAHLNVNITM
jgi:hypothetical protein